MEMPTCPECGGETFERVTEETWVNHAEYVDGKLEVKVINSCVFDSHVRCANEKCGFQNFKDPVEIEELFW
jgi:predicted  nucleic acid-binding Zn-ribbon protein